MLVTPEGKVTIPKRVRRTLGIFPNSEVNFIEENGKFYIVKKEKMNGKSKFKALRGIASTNLTTDEIMQFTRES